jgi:AhpD family alkylhydroperoxidase
MKDRIKIDPVSNRSAYKAMLGLVGYLNQGNLSKTIRDLMEIRASQINGCAFCLNLHIDMALKHGEDSRRIHLLDAWQEADLYTEEEKVALQMTEEITLIHQGGVSDETYEQATRFFDEEQIAQLIMTVVTINAWNRIEISTQKPIGDWGDESD